MEKCLFSISSIIDRTVKLDRRHRLVVRFFSETFIFLLVYGIYKIFFWPDLINGYTKFDSVVLNTLSWIFLYKFFKLDHDRLRFSSTKSYISILKISVSMTLISACESMFVLKNTDLLALSLYLFVLSNLLIIIRLIARQVIRDTLSGDRRNILIYGTSSISMELMNTLAFSTRYRVKGFLDESTFLHNHKLSGLPVIAVTS